MKTPPEFPSLYTEIADWWPVLSTPEDYAEEAAFFHRTIQAAAAAPLKTMLELGSGGGNNASHLKAHYQMTLVDLAPGMLAVSQQLNPECEHLQGDMRSFRLDRQFDAVFIHDAITYMQTASDLAQAVETAYLHCKPGGVALFAPDHTRESYQPSTSQGGHDRGERSLRYLEWGWDPDDSDTTVVSHMVYLLREGLKNVRCVLDHHTLGIFPHQTWLDLITAAGFQVQAVPFEHSEIEPDSIHFFLALKP